MLQDPITRDLIDPADELRRVLEELRVHVRCCEKEAADTGHAVLGDFMVGDDERGEPILRIRFICEPREEARLISVDGLGEHYSTEEARPPVLH